MHYDSVDGVYSCGLMVFNMHFLRKSRMFENPIWCQTTGANELALTELIKQFAPKLVSFDIYRYCLIHPRRQQVVELIKKFGIGGKYANQVLKGEERFLFHPERKTFSKGGVYYK